MGISAAPLEWSGQYRPASRVVCQMAKGKRVESRESRSKEQYPFRFHLAWEILTAYFSRSVKTDVKPVTYRVRAL